MSREKSLVVTDILNRLKVAYGKKSDSALALFLGVKPNTISMWKKRGFLDFNLIFTRCDDISPSWIMTGEGAVSLTDEKRFSAVIDIDTRSPAWRMCKQIERIVTEGDKNKIEAIKGMLKALDPGEIPLEGMGDGENAGAEAASDLPSLKGAKLL